jgi:hypothetical protein
MIMKKVRSDSKLDALPEARKIELRDGLLGGWRYEDARAWLAGECGVSSSLAAISGFYRRECAPVIRERRQVAALKAEVLGDMAGETDWDLASIESLKQMAFEVMASPAVDIKKTEKIFRLLLKRKDQEIAERQLRLREDAAAQAKRQLEAATARAKAKGGISEETLRELEEAAKLL